MNSRFRSNGVLFGFWILQAFFALLVQPPNHFGPSVNALMCWWGTQKGGQSPTDELSTDERGSLPSFLFPFPSPLNFFLAPSSLCLSCTGWRRGDINSCQVEFLTHFKLPFWWSHPIRGSEEVTTISAKYVCVRYGVVSRINNWNYVRLCLSCANFLQNGCVAGFTKSQQIRH